MSKTSRKWRHYGTISSTCLLMVWRLVRRLWPLLTIDPAHWVGACTTKRTVTNILSQRQRSFVEAPNQHPNQYTLSSYVPLLSYYGSHAPRQTHPLSRASTQSSLPHSMGLGIIPSPYKQEFSGYSLQYAGRATIKITQIVWAISVFLRQTKIDKTLEKRCIHLVT